MSSDSEASKERWLTTQLHISAVTSAILHPGKHHKHNKQLVLSLYELSVASIMQHCLGIIKASVSVTLTSLPTATHVGKGVRKCTHSHPCHCPHSLAVSSLGLFRG